MQNKKYYFFLVLFISFVGVAYSQINKGDALYNDAQYFEAIPFYKKEVHSKKSTQKQAALIKLGNSYKFINDYANAEDAYKNAIALDSTAITAETYYNYAQVLKVNGKYPESAMQLSRYIDLAPNDENAKKTLKFINEIKYYLAQPIEYKVKNIETINTEQAEFSPVVMGNKLMFVAERESFDFINYEVNSYDGQPYLHMYVSAMDGDKIKKSKTLSKHLTSDYHDGPACISADGRTLYFTRVSGSDKKGVISNSKIYTAVGADRSWKDIKPLDAINSDDYTVGHPSISHDNSTLFFVSNMPGGYGGKDIWFVKYDTTSKVWSKPVNVGPDVNTSGDEMFPTIRKDNTLYFSSNGLPGFGGLDIYSAKQNGTQWLLERNEGLDVNSSGDDFGVTFKDDSIGYFSSNRTGGKGKDDIYMFKYAKKSKVEVEGTMLLSKNLKDFAKNKKVKLFDESGRAVDSTTTDEAGYFAFKNLSSDKKYMAVIDEDESGMAGGNYYLAEKDSALKGVTVKLPNGKFAFKNLPLDPNALPNVDPEDIAYSGKLFAGDADKKPMKNVKLKIIDANGKVLEEVVTDENGVFTFKNIPADANYIITLDEGDVQLAEGTKVTLTNKTGKEVKSFYKTKDNFSFKVLPNEKNAMSEIKEEEEIAFAGTLMSGDRANKVLKNVKVKILNQKGEVIGETTTNEFGAFAFRNIPGDQNFIVSIDEGDVNLPVGTKVTMTNKGGKEVKSFYKAKEDFSFKVLSSDKQIIKDMDIDDADLAMGIYGFLYDQDNKPIANTKIKIKDEDGSNEQQVVTNKAGKFNFNKLNADKNYLFEIDENDPNLAGITRISIADNKGKVYKVVERQSGKFAFKILDADKNAMGEFLIDEPTLIAQKKKALEKKREIQMGLTGFLFDQDSKAIENAKIKVKDVNGDNQQETTTSTGGKFKFDNLNANKNYMFEIDEHDLSLRGVSKVSIADGSGKIYKVVEMAGGKFAFKILDADKNVMGEFKGEDPMLVARRKKEQVKDKQKQEELAKEGKLIGNEPPKEKDLNPPVEEPIIDPEEELEATITIVENIYYAYGSFSVTPEAEITLNKAVDALLEYPKLILEISSHTDAQSSSGFNLGLSRRRAQAAVDYLVAKGVERRRLKATGYGETRLLNKCSDGVVCSDEEHKINRRTEFKLTKPVVKQPKQPNKATKK